jgi:hypothetical protein
MQARHPGITIADFVLRFAALLALTLAVLAGVAVRARDRGPARPEAGTQIVKRESATEINSRRYPLVHPGSGSLR